MNGHSYSTFIGPLPSSGSSPGLPLTLDNNSCTPTPNPSITTTSNADIEDGTNTTTSMNKYEGTIDSIESNNFLLRNTWHNNMSLQSKKYKKSSKKYSCNLLNISIKNTFTAMEHKVQNSIKYESQQQTSQNQHDHHHPHEIDNRSYSTDSPNDQSSLIILQPSGVSNEIASANSASGLGTYSPMLPSFSHYAPGKFEMTKNNNNTSNIRIG